MSAATTMSKDKQTAPPSDSAEEKKNVKVRSEFHKRLKRIAHELDIDIGVLVERELEDFINREEQALKLRLGGS